MVLPWADLSLSGGTGSLRQSKPTFFTSLSLFFVRSCFLPDNRWHGASGIWRELLGDKEEELHCTALLYMVTAAGQVRCMVVQPMHGLCSLLELRRLQLQQYSSDLLSDLAWLLLKSSHIILSLWLSFQVTGGSNWGLIIIGCHEFRDERPLDNPMGQGPPWVPVDMAPAWAALFWERGRWGASSHVPQLQLVLCPSFWLP